MTPQYRLTTLFWLTVGVALIAYGVGVSRVDWQTGGQIMLFSFALSLATLVLRLSRITWIALGAGFVIGTIKYWWAVTYQDVTRADRLFLLVQLTIWCSILVALPVEIAVRLVQHGKRS